MDYGQAASEIAVTTVVSSFRDQGQGREMLSNAEAAAMLSVACGSDTLNKLKSLKCFHELSQTQQISPVADDDADYEHSPGQILS